MNFLINPRTKNFHRERRSDWNNADRVKRKRKCLYIGTMLLAIMLIVLVTAVVYLEKMHGIRKRQLRVSFDFMKHLHFFL